MDSEQIVFIIVALAISILGMFLKSKKRKPQSQQEEDALYEYQPEEDIYSQDLASVFEQKEIHHSHSNLNIYSKINKKRLKTKNVETIDRIEEIPKINLQDVDIENEINLLKDFEGTEIQKAFLYGEIFKNTKN